MTSDIIMGVVILVLILLSAFFSAIETAFSFVNKVRVQRYKDDGNKKAAAALYIIEHFDNALTTILICNNVVNLSCSSIATVLCMNLFGDAGSAIATVRLCRNVLQRNIAMPFHSKQPDCSEYL